MCCIRRGARRPRETRPGWGRAKMPRSATARHGSARPPRLREAGSLSSRRHPAPAADRALQSCAGQDGLAGRAGGGGADCALAATRGAGRPVPCAGEGWVRGSPGGPDYRARRDPAIRRTGRSPSPAGGCGGGGSAHRGRTLDATTARQMVMVRETRRAFRRFRRTCFWSYRADLEIGADDVAWVAEQLMKHGHREAWRVGARLCR